MDVSFSISQRGILFLLEMGADVKAISVSEFTVKSLEPAKSQGQMSVLLIVPCSKNICELFHPCPSYLLPKRSKISQLREDNIHSITEAEGLFFEDREGCFRSWEQQEKSPQHPPGPGNPHDTDLLGPRLEAEIILGMVISQPTFYSSLFTFSSSLSNSTPNTCGVGKTEIETAEIIAPFLLIYIVIM